jgi:hypothetical protein
MRQSRRQVSFAARMPSQARESIPGRLRVRVMPRGSRAGADEASPGPGDAPAARGATIVRMEPLRELDPAGTGVGDGDR